jgi:hypothetical protein
MKIARMFGPALVLWLAAPAVGQESKPSTGTTAALEAKFGEMMQGASLSGYFTVAGQKEAVPQSENYHVSKIEKLDGGRWLFTARMQFGGRDVTMPMPFEVAWAGDTPVITLTNQEIPGLGTFTARILIYGDRYAGTWQHGPAGGHMWGKVEKTTPER